STIGRAAIRGGAASRAAGAVIVVARVSASTEQTGQDRQAGQAQALRSNRQTACVWTDIQIHVSVESTAAVVTTGLAVSAEDSADLHGSRQHIVKIDVDTVEA